MMEPSKSFKDLITWKKAHEFVLSVYSGTKEFPKEEMYGLSSQFRRASVSIAANIAEGFRKKGNADKLRYYNIAQASLEEAKYYCILSKDLDYCNTNKLILQSEELTKLLDAYIRGLKKNG